VRDVIERGSPVGGAKAVGVPDEGCQQSVRMAALQVTLDPLGAEHATVDGEVLPGFEPDDRILPDLELDTTLHPAEAAARLHQSLGCLAPLPPPRWGVVQMRAVCGGELCERLRQRWHWARPPIAVACS